MNSSGLTIGYSERNPDETYPNQGTPWLWDGTSLTELGLDGPEYRDNLNRRSSGVLLRGINDAGDIVGSSGRFNGSQSLGSRPWLLRNGVYQPLGLTGGDYTMSGGYENSTAVKLNQAGQVLGWSQRRDALSNIGWITDGTQYRYVGLVTPDNESVTPFQQSIPQMMNEAGQAAGSAYIYDGSSVNTYATWFYDGAQTRRIGLTGDEFTGDLTGFQRSELTALSDGGYVLGKSSLVQQTYDFGTATWVSDGQTTRRTGLWDAQHTRADGWQYSYSPFVNNSGRSAGFSNRFSGQTDLGSTAWVDDGATTRVVGDYGGAFTRADGYQLSGVSLLNNAGDAVGVSARYAGTSEAGRTGWYYDAVTGTTTDLVSTVAPPGGWDGQAFIDFTYLGDDGTVFGDFRTYPGGGSTPLEELFAWTPDGGLTTLASHVVSGLANWNSLSAISAVSGSDLFGGGVAGANGNQFMSFRLTALAAADLNHDQIVDQHDLAIIRSHFGSQGSAGDVNQDGAVNGLDILLWQRQVNAGPGGSTAAVPEPRAMLLSVGALAVVVCYRRGAGGAPMSSR